MSEQLIVVGAGNVGQALIRRLANIDDISIKVIIKSPVHIPAELTNKRIEYHTLNTLTKLENPLVIICTKDQQINQTSQELANYFNSKTIIAHTSGSYGPEIIDSYFKHRSVFYPLQSFTKGRIPNWEDIPIFIEANVTATAILEKLANRMGCKTHEINQEGRLFLHVASVFTNNFTNANLMVAQTLLDKKGMSLQLIKALMQETIEKAFILGPLHAQTGPAKRNDQNTISKHIEFLKTELPDSVDVYKSYSEFINKFI